MDLTKELLKIEAYNVVTPGIYVRECDLSMVVDCTQHEKFEFGEVALITEEGRIGGTFMVRDGDKWREISPAPEPIVVSSAAEMIDIYGRPNLRGSGQSFGVIDELAFYPPATHFRCDLDITPEDLLDERYTAAVEAIMIEEDRLALSACRELIDNGIDWKGFGANLGETVGLGDFWKWSEITEVDEAKIAAMGINLNETPALHSIESLTLVYSEVYSKEMRKLIDSWTADIRKTWDEPKAECVTGEDGVLRINVTVTPVMPLQYFEFEIEDTPAPEPVKTKPTVKERFMAMKYGKKL